MSLKYTLVLVIAVLVFAATSFADDEYSKLPKLRGEIPLIPYGGNPPQHRPPRGNPPHTEVNGNSLAKSDNWNWRYGKPPQQDRPPVEGNKYKPPTAN
ncbi:early nodulin-75-like [Sesbania bispinosa]|nr:early nodulin-75-like [Sesbania bispinosa]